VKQENNPAKLRRGAGKATPLSDIAVINPLYAAAFVGGAAVIGFLVWRLLLKK